MNRRLGTYSTPSGAVVVMLHAVPLLRVELADPGTDLDAINLAVRPITYSTDPETWPTFTVSSTVTLEPAEYVEQHEQQLRRILDRLNHKRNRP